MHSDRMAEWLLSRWTGPRRAAAIVGDLLEIREQKSTSWYWLALAGALLRLAWRPIVATLAGFYAGAYAFSFFQMAIWGTHVRHTPPADYAWTPVFSVLSGCGSILCLVLVYASIRYGIHDRLSQLALVLTALSVPLAWWWWKPPVVAACLASLAVVTLGSLFHRELRRALPILAAVLGVGIAGGLLTVYAIDRFFLVMAATGHRELLLQPEIGWGIVLLTMITAALMMATCSRLHARLLEKQEEGPEIDSGSLPAA
jgi:hypothetical protein